MSVSLIAASVPGGALDIEVPIATNAVFLRYWFPVAQALGLTWVPAFLDGFDVTWDMVPDVLVELALLERYFAEHAGSTDQQLVPRVRHLRNWLAEAKGRGVGRIYIG